MLDEIRRTVRKIPEGKVATYGDVAAAAGFPGAARQVVWALHNAGGSLPWHRVLGAGGRIRLPGEAGFEQRMRLRSEGVEFRGDRVRMDLHQWNGADPKADKTTPGRKRGKSRKKEQPTSAHPRKKPLPGHP